MHIVRDKISPVPRKIAAGSRKVSRKHMLQCAEQLYGQFFFMKPLMWLGHVAQNHFKLFVSAVLVAILQRFGESAVISAARLEST